LPHFLWPGAGETKKIGWDHNKSIAEEAASAGNRSRGFRQEHSRKPQGMAAGNRGPRTQQRGRKESQQGIAT